MKVTVSAPGKIHLMGEHAVVYGKPAVLAAVSQRLYVTLEYQKSKIKNQKLNTLKDLRKKNSYINAIAETVEKHFNVKNTPDISITISSTIPQGCGMGSSAALSAALIGALTSFLGKPWNVSQINELAFVAEKHQHGNPSGGDNSVVSFGGMLWFRREFSFLRTFWMLPIKFPKNFPSILLVNTGKPIEDTREMVEKVSKSNHEEIFNQIEKETKRLVQGIHDENIQDVEKAMQEGEKLLEQLGVVSKNTQTFIKELKKLGGYGKISGAGGVKKGSGIVIALHKDPKIMTQLARKYEFETFATRLGEAGVRIENMST